MLRIKLLRSPIAAHWRTRRTIEALGLRKISQVLEKEDTPSIRGMIRHVREFLLVEDVETNTVISDSRTMRKVATRKGRKPSEKTRRSGA